MKTDAQLHTDRLYQVERNKAAVKALRELARKIERGEIDIDALSSSRNWEHKESSEMRDEFLELEEWELHAKYHLIYSWKR